MTETFGAMVAAMQARRAADDDVRCMMHAIAADELRHAALSWELAHWLEKRLDARGRERVVAARERAIAAIERAIDASVAVPAMGLPGPDAARAALALLRGPLTRGISPSTPA